MFNDIGKKIKAVAALSAALGMIASLIVGLVLMSEDSVGLGLVTIIFGSLLSWVSSFALYGFGELVDNSAKTAANSAKIVSLLGGEPVKEAEEETEPLAGEYELLDENGNKRILTSVGGNRYKDDLGHYWVMVNEGEFQREQP